MAAKGPRENITLECTECKRRNYMTSKNKRNNTERLEVEKYCKETEAKYGVKVSYEVLQSSESPATPVDAPVVKLLAAAIKKTRNIDAKIIGIGGGTVGAELRREGYNAAVWSTLAECAHMLNEFFVIQNMKDDALTLAALMLE